MNLSQILLEIHAIAANQNLPAEERVKALRLLEHATETDLRRLARANPPGRPDPYE